MRVGSWDFSLNEMAARPALGKVSPPDCVRDRETPTPGASRPRTTQTAPDREENPVRRRSIVFGSVRSRIAIGISLMAGLALLGSAVAAYLVLIDDVEDRVVRREARDVREFEAMASDPATRARFPSAEDLMAYAQHQQLPGQNELILTYVSGSEFERSPGRNIQGLDDPTELAPILGAIEESLPGGGWRYVETRIGTAVVAIVPVEGTPSGAYVIAYFTDRERSVYLNMVKTYGVVALVAWLLVSGGAWLLAGRVLRPVRALRRTARAISESDLSRRIDAEGDDDLTDLAVTFNEMLDRLQGSFVLQRQFLDDAGHELQTPLTILGCHLAAFETECHPAQERLRGLMVSEVGRLTRMVKEMTTLAKANHPDFVRPRVCDAGQLTEHALDQSRGLGARDWKLDARTSARVCVDPQRITEALLQLTENAVRHTTDGDTIGLGSALDGDHVRWWVRDSGAGVAPADRERIFDRFARVAASESDRGSGLGLSIVRAIADAHGGQVWVEPNRDHGATFVMRLPNADVGAGTSVRVWS